MKAAATRRKEEENKAKGDGASSSAPMATENRAPKRKADGKDNCPTKKPSVTPEDKLPKKPLLPKPSHGAGKRLMTISGPVTQGPDRHLLTHNDYTEEVIESIIKDKDVNPCAEQATEELGASGLFDLARVCFLLSLFLSLFFYAQ